MAAMWFAIFSAFLLQVNGYAFNPQQFKDTINPVYRAELPFNCPFHQEPASIGHLEDTVIGTVKQDGNFAFTKYPENILANLNHVNKLKPIKDKIQSSFGQQFQTQNYPSFDSHYEKPHFNYDKPQINQEYGWNNDYGNYGNEVASILPYYGNDYTPEYEKDQTFSILPYFESDHQYKDPSYVFRPESESEEYGEEEEKQENDRSKILDICVRNKVNIDLIYEGADEEVTDSEANVARKAKAAMSTLAQLKLGKNPALGPRIDSFKRGLFSSFLPKTPRSVFGSATQSVSSGLNLLSNPLAAINTIKKEVEANIPGASVLSQVTNKIITRTPINQIAEQIKPKVENLIQQTEVENLPKIEDEIESKPELISKIEAAVESPEPKNTNEEVEIVNQEDSSELEQSGIKLKIEESLEKATSCINGADAVMSQLVGKVRHALSELYKNAKEVHFDKEEQLNMCAHSQFAFCQEEVDSMEENKTQFATNTNGELAALTTGEDIHASTVNACVAQATAMQSYLQNVATDLVDNDSHEEEQLIEY